MPRRLWHQSVTELNRDNAYSAALVRAGAGWSQGAGRAGDGMCSAWHGSYACMLAHLRESSGLGVTRRGRNARPDPTLFARLTEGRA